MAGEKTDGYELRLERLLDASRANVWRCWTEPKLLVRWFAPPSWTAEVQTLEPRPGGDSHIVLRGPNGEISDGVGVFLEAVPERRLVFTNTFTSGWMPAEHPAVVPFMTTFIEMSNEADQTRHVVRALHWNEKARQQHEKRGFHAAWAQACGRLEALARTLSRLADSPMLKVGFGRTEAIPIKGENARAFGSERLLFAAASQGDTLRQ